jgi:hypothetical protein
VADALAALLGSPAVAARCRVPADRLRNTDPLTQACLEVEQAVTPSAPGA